MKNKIFSLIAVVLFSFSLMSTSPSKSDMLVDEGGASECAQYARQIILDAADTYNLDISRGGSHFNIMMEAYHAIYLDCYNN